MIAIVERKRVFGGVQGFGREMPPGDKALGGDQLVEGFFNTTTPPALRKIFGGIFQGQAEGMQIDIIFGTCTPATKQSPLLQAGITGLQQCPLTEPDRLQGRLHGGPCALANPNRRNHGRLHQGDVKPAVGHGAQASGHQPAGGAATYDHDFSRCHHLSVIRDLFLAEV